MPRPRRSPSKEDLKKYLAQGLTHQQIADAHLVKTGEQVTADAISVAISRAGLSGRRPRYDDTVPWLVKDEHSRMTRVQVLRDLGRRRRGMELPERRTVTLDNFLQMLEETNSVVGYNPYALNQSDQAEVFPLFSRNEVPTEYLHPEIPITTFDPLRPEDAATVAKRGREASAKARNARAGIERRDERQREA